MNLVDTAKDQTLAESIAKLASSGKWLQGFESYSAVVHCAQMSDLGQSMVSTLAGWNSLDPGNDFSLFVGPEDEDVLTPIGLGRLEAGAFLAFIRVDEPEAGQEKGLRHLVHAMITLGKGCAAGYDNRPRIGVGTAGVWEKIDLVRALNWLEVSNGVDCINGASITDRVSNPLRMRYRFLRSSRRPLSVGSNAMPTREDKQAKWGAARASQRVADEMATRAPLHEPVNIEVAMTGSIAEQINPRAPGKKYFIRPMFLVPIDQQISKYFFNSPNGIRGHYYIKSEIGDKYSEDIIGMIYPKVNFDINNFVYKFGKEIEDLKLDQSTRDALLGPVKTFLVTYNGVPDLIRHGKIWIDEISKDKTAPRWITGDLDYPVCDRWNCGDSSSERIAKMGDLVKKFVADCALDPEYHNETMINQRSTMDDLMKKFPTNDAKFIASKLGTMILGPKVDIKGAWISIDDSKKYKNLPWVLQKVSRGNQIKWFGYT